MSSSATSLERGVAFTPDQSGYPDFQPQVIAPVLLQPTMASLWGEFSSRSRFARRTFIDVRTPASAVVLATALPPHPPPSAPPAPTPPSNLPEPSISPYWNALSPRSRYVSSPPSRDRGPFHGEVPLGQMVLVASWYPPSPPTSEFRDSPLIDQVYSFLWSGWRSPQTAPTQGFHRDTAFTVMREFHRVSEASYHALRQDLSIMEAKLFDFPKRFR